MFFDGRIHHRRSTRLKEHDYSWPGWYYVTICAHDHELLFGTIADNIVHLNSIGKIVNEEWMRTPSIRPNIDLNEFIIMPNHLHGIVIIGDRRGVSPYAPTRAFRSPSQSLGAIIRGFKSSSTKRINLARGTPGLPVWQRDFYDHIIRNDADLHRIRAYIRNNPAQWALDEESQKYQA